MASFGPVLFDLFEVFNNEMGRHYSGPQCRGTPPASKSENAQSNPAASTPVTKLDFVPAVDIYETDSAFFIHASLPGASPNAISVNFEPKTNEVVLAGEIKRPAPFTDHTDSLRVSERRVGNFERRVRLGPSVKIISDNISAKLINGVLEVSVPKVAELPSRKITVETVANPADDWIDAASESPADKISPEAEKLD
ncbi:HSP20-like chaperone [Kockiozyma suomiensis]|uniref:HSP20-like chaperone n=1 Tax=Kockiozyma suomiensis TaxID=1337062 RepID=UPI0033440EBA